MKKIILTSIILFSIHNFMFGQSACELLKQASVAYCNNEINKTIESLNEFIESYPNHELYEEVLIKVGDLYLEINDLDKAEVTYLSFWSNVEISNTSEFETSVCPLNYDKLFPKKIFGCRRIVYNTKKSELKHSVSFNLSKVSYQKEKYSQALEFLKIADFKYPNSSHCGVGIAESANEFALLYNKIYTKLGNTDLALEKLLEQSFEMNNRIILEEINKLLKEKYSKEEIKSEIKNSIKSLKVIPADSAKRTIERYYITLFDKEIEYHNHLDHITSISIKEKIAKSNLFSLISK